MGRSMVAEVSEVLHPDDWFIKINCYLSLVNLKNMLLKVTAAVKHKNQINHSFNTQLNKRDKQTLAGASPHMTGCCLECKGWMFSWLCLSHDFSL